VCMPAYVDICCSPAWLAVSLYPGTKQLLSSSLKSSRCVLLSGLCVGFGGFGFPPVPHVPIVDSSIPFVSVCFSAFVCVCVRVRVCVDRSVRRCWWMPLCDSRVGRRPLRRQSPCGVARSEHGPLPLKLQRQRDRFVCCGAGSAVLFRPPPLRELALAYLSPLLCSGPRCPIVPSPLFPIFCRA
jgi:hypothetical protein